MYSRHKIIQYNNHNTKMETKLEFTHAPNDIKVWYINLEDKKITIQFGKKDKKLRTTNIDFGDTKSAKTEYDKRIGKKINEGYVNINDLQDETDVSDEEIVKNSDNKIELVNPFLSFLKSITTEYTKIFEKNMEKNEDEFYCADVDTDKYHEKRVKAIEKYFIQQQNENIRSFEECGIIQGNINEKISSELLDLINKYCDKQKPDYHPKSNNRIRDIVHPSLYPYMDERVTPTKYPDIIPVEKDNAKYIPDNIVSDNDNEELDENKKDYWNRPYEQSKYQWLPSEFGIDANGKCKINSYINNLPVTEKDMYAKIEQLFDFVLPEFERIWSYSNYVHIYDLADKWRDVPNDKSYKLLSLKNTNLQVIVKIVKIEFNKKDVLEGAWHVEGMSHENIIGTATCTLEQDDNFDAILYFKRQYTTNEAEKIVMTTPQNPPTSLSKILNSGIVPLGKIEIKNNMYIVFPNSHIHKIDMKSKKKASRTIVVFWLINPNKKIISTKNIEQQNYDIEKAYENRLELMRERTFYKNSFNIRNLNLCEH